MFDTDDGTPGNRAHRGQGNHNISAGDVDGDGHGDAMHFGDLDPERPGLEVFKGNGDGANEAGLQLRDARTGEQIWGAASTGKAGVPRACNMGCWWDGDLLRELLDGVGVTKWDHLKGREGRLLSGDDYGAAPNNGSKSNPCLCADILGDWREEVVARRRDGKEPRIFATTIPTEHRIHTPAHDPIYRLGVAWQNVGVGYNQPARPGFYLGHGMTLPAPKPNITTGRAR